MDPVDLHHAAVDIAQRGRVTILRNLGTPVRWGSLITVPIAVLHPLPYVPQYIVQSKPFRLVRACRCRERPSVPACRRSVMVTLEFGVRTGIASVGMPALILCRLSPVPLRAPLPTPRTPIPPRSAADTPLRFAL